MPSAFEVASALVKRPAGADGAAPARGEVSFTAQIPLGWDQGRGAFGGLVLGLLARAVETANADPGRPLRALLGDITGPVLPGPVQLATRLLRRGNSQTNLAVELTQAGEVLAIGSAVLGAPRRSAMPAFPLEAPPPPPDFRTVAPVRIGPPHGPAFGLHLEFRPIDGTPYTQAATPDVRGFVRLEGQDGPLDAPALIALLDAHWPGVLAMSNGPRPTATVSFAGQIFCEPAALDWRVPLYYRSRIAAQQGGYFLELRELWQAGVPVAMNQQTMALIK